MNLADLYTFLNGYGIATVYPDSRPETSSLPCLVYKQVADTPDSLLDGTLAGTSSARIQIDIYTTDHSQQNTLAGSLLTSLCGYRGALGSNTTAITIRLNDDIENPENAATTGDDWIYQRSLDFQIRYFAIPATSLSLSTLTLDELAALTLDQLNTLAL